VLSGLHVFFVCLSVSVSMSRLVERFDSSNDGSVVVMDFVQRDSPTLIRYVNNLDVGVSVTIDATHFGDHDFQETEQLGTNSVPSSDVASDYLTEPWERIRVTVTPDSNPSSGEFELRRM